MSLHRRAVEAGLGLVSTARGSIDCSPVLDLDDEPDPEPLELFVEDRGVVLLFDHLGNELAIPPRRIGFRAE